MSKPTAPPFDPPIPSSAPLGPRLYAPPQTPLPPTPIEMSQIVNASLRAGASYPPGMAWPSEAPKGSGSGSGAEKGESLASQIKRAEKANVIWTGTTWPWWPLCCCFAPVFCSSIHWTVTRGTVDRREGCCGRKEETLDMRHVRDMDYSGCCCRGTIHLYSDDNDKITRINHCCIHDLYRIIRMTWQSVNVVATGP